MFKELEKILDTMDVSITLSKKGDLISYMFIPRVKGGEKVNIPPLTGTGTAEELDAGIAQVILDGLVANKEAINNLEEFKSKVSKSKSKASTTSSSSTASTSSNKPADKPAATPPSKKFKDSAPPKNNKNEVKIYESIKKNMEQALIRGTEDPDMVDFYRKQDVELCKKIGSNKNMCKLVEERYAEIKEEAAKRRESKNATKGTKPAEKAVTDDKATSKTKESNTAKREDKPVAPVKDEPSANTSNTSSDTEISNEQNEETNQEGNAEENDVQEETTNGVETDDDVENNDKDLQSENAAEENEVIQEDVTPEDDIF